MNYKPAPDILSKIKESKNILINCHDNPDMDSVGSALALARVVGKMAKEVKVISPTKVPDYLGFVPGINMIEVVEMDGFDFSKYDLFILLDSGSWDMVLGSNDINPPNIKTVVIDHHKTNNAFGSEVNLIDDKVTSTAEIIFLLFKDWQVVIDPETATLLMTGILGDTGVFRFPGVTPRTLRISADLMDLGADKEGIIYHTSFSLPHNILKFWGELLGKMVVNNNLKYAYSAMANERLRELDITEEGASSFSTNFGQSIDGTEMSFFIIEKEPGVLSVSLRSRRGRVDVSEIALELGGGGHLYASGATVKGYDFDNGVQYIIGIVEKHLIGK